MLPNMRRSLAGWIKRQYLIVVTQTIVEGEALQIPSTPIIKMINVQPMPTEQINRKVEEKRSWSWYNIFCESSLILNIDDLIIVDGITYKIQQKNNYKLHGFLSYEAIQDFTGYIPQTT